MSRTIDRLPMPEKAKQMKVVVASPSRTGTFGLYLAMQILGYKPYHFYECLACNGVEHVRIAKEAIIAQHNRFSGLKKLTRQDCDKWFANYDCLIEIPSYFGSDMLKAYAEDPDVKFILTERPPKNWAKSYNNTAGKGCIAASQFPLNVLKYFDSFVWEFVELSKVVYHSVSAGSMPTDADNEEALCKYYNEYIGLVKATIPADRLLCIHLERDGLDWEDICPFLDLPVPDVAYPGRNDPQKFEALVGSFLTPRIILSAAKLGAFAISTLGVMGWAAMRYGPSAIGRVRIN